MTAQATAYSFSDGMDLREEEVTAWLRRVGALRAPGQTAVAAAASRGARAQDGSSEVVARHVLTPSLHGVYVGA